MAHRVAPRAEIDLDDIWLYAAKESGSMDVATRLIDSIADRFLFLASFPYAGRTRDEDLGAGPRSFAVGSTSSYTASKAGTSHSPGAPRQT